MLSYFLTDETGKVLECDDISVIHFRKIIVDKKYPQKSKKYCLAVDIHVMSEKLGKNYQYILEAGNGNIIFEQDLVCNMLFVYILVRLYYRCVMSVRVIA